MTPNGATEALFHGGLADGLVQACLSKGHLSAAPPDGEAVALDGSLGSRFGATWSGLSCEAMADHSLGLTETQSLQAKVTPAKDGRAGVQACEALNDVWMTPPSW